MPSERPNGNRAWIETDARVLESRVQEVDFLGKPSREPKDRAYSDLVIKIQWSDQKGMTHSSQIEAPEDSSLFQLIEGDKVKIRFNPNRPDEFQVPGLGRDQAASALKRVIFAIVIFAVVILIWFGPDLLIAFSK